MLYLFYIFTFSPFFFLLYPPSVSLSSFSPLAFLSFRFLSFFSCHLFCSSSSSSLQNLLFCPSSPFLHQPSSVAANVPTFSDMDMMVRCLVAQFRLNHRNTHTFNICINSDSPPSFKLAFLQALFVLLKEVSVYLSLSLSYLYLTPSLSVSLSLSSLLTLSFCLSLSSLLSLPSLSFYRNRPCHGGPIPLQCMPMLHS